MQWDLDQGDGLSDLITASQGVGPAADAVRHFLETERPKFTAWESFVWDTFGTLASERVSLGPIPWSKIKEYGVWHGMTRDEVNGLIPLVMALDNYLIAYRNREAEKKSK